MLRISKLADYGTAIMVYLARHPDRAYTAKDIAANTHLTLPTVSKLLKLLARANLLASQRGARGGYSLSIPAEQISVARVISVFDGNIALTECSHTAELCTLESSCITRNSWRVINRAIYQVLDSINIAAMTHLTSLPVKLFGEHHGH